MHSDPSEIPGPDVAEPSTATLPADAFDGAVSAIDPMLVRRVVEAALLAAQRPLSVAQLAELFPDDAALPQGAVEHALGALRDDCAERGVELVEVASGFRYQIRADVQPFVSRLWAERQVKYTRATLETLALIAYRQPITRAEIEQVRGVAVHSNLIKSLEEREWIRVVGHRDVPGKPALFGTTRNFLDYFGLASLDQLPALAELNEIADLDPELPFEAAPTLAAIMHGDDDASTSEPHDRAGPADDDASVDSGQPDRPDSDLSDSDPSDPAHIAGIPDHDDAPGTDAGDAAQEQTHD